MKINSSIECLESRIAPAALLTYTFANGTLTATVVSAAGETASVEVFQLDKTHFRLTGPLSTGGVNPDQSYQDFTGPLTALVLNGGAGREDITLTGLTGLKQLTIGTTGSSADSLDCEDLVVKGPVNLSGLSTVGFYNDTLISGDLTMTASQSAVGTNTSVGFFGDSVRINGALNLAGGPDLLTVDLVGGATVIGKGLNLTSGAGGMNFDASGYSLTVGKNSVGQSVTIVGKSGDDSIRLRPIVGVYQGSLDYSEVAGATGGANSLSVGAGSASVRIGKDSRGLSVAYAGGTGTDALSFDGQALTADGAVSFLAAGTDSSLGFYSAVTKVGKTTDGRSVSYFGSTGTDFLGGYGIKATYAGSIEFSGEGTPARDPADVSGKMPADSVEFTGAEFSAGKNSVKQSINFFGSTANDSLNLSFFKATLAGSVEFTAGGTIYDDAGTPGDLSDDPIQGDTFNLAGGTIKLGSSTNGSSLLYLGGNNADSVNLSPGTLTTTGLVALDGGEGAGIGDGFNYNSFLFTPTKATLGKSATGKSLQVFGGDDFNELRVFTNNLKVLGALDYVGADGDNSVRFDASGMISGAVNLDLGAGLNADLTLGSATAGGNLKFLKPLSILSTPTEGEIVSLHHLILNDALSVRLGAGVSDLAIDNLVAAKSVLIDTGAGNDLVNLETGVDYGASIFKGAVNIRLGSGTDVVNVGSASTPAYGSPSAGLNTKAIFSNAFLIEQEGGALTVNGPGLLSGGIARLLADNVFSTKFPPDIQVALTPAIPAA